jgi:hypothetical protein
MSAMPNPRAVSISSSSPTMSISGDSLNKARLARAAGTTKAAHEKGPAVTGALWCRSAGLAAGSGLARKP